MRLRSTRGWPSVARALGLEGPCEAQTILARCQAMAPDIEVRVSCHPSRARPEARGRYLAGEIILFPRAFEDAQTLTHTLLHELAHARGLSEEEAEASAQQTLAGLGGGP
jgi:hypothetical protein